MPTQESSSPSLRESLEFFKNYREFVFPAMGEYMEDAPLGPVAPWSAYNPYETISEVWNYLLTIDRKTLFPEHPFKEGMLPGSFAMWDYILTGGISKRRNCQSLDATGTARNLQPVRSECVNTFWTENMKHAFSFDIPDSKYIVDFRNIPEGKRMLDAAHALAHYRCNSRLLDTSSTIRLHSRLTDEFLKAAAEMAIGYHLGLHIDVKTQGADIPMAYGLCVRPSTTLGFDIEMPVLRVPVRNCMSATVNKTLAYVCAVVQVGHDPVKILNGANACHPKDWWSYQPMRIFIAGWETAAHMSMQPLVYPDSTFWHGRDTYSDFACHAKDLFPATTLDHYVKLGREYMPLDDRYVNVMDWVNSEDCGIMIRNAPPLPCHTCMYMYNDYAEGIHPPKGPRPIRKKKMPEDWDDYFYDFKRAYKMVTTSKKRMHIGPSYRAEVAERRRNFKRIIAEAKRRIRVRTKW